MPLQVVPLNMFCNRNIKSLTWMKSARIGYTKVVVGGVSSLLAQFKANAVIYQPTENDAKDFVIDEIDESWEDMSIMRRIFPSLFAKDEKNTVSKKKGLGWTLHILGANTPRNMRRITKSVAVGDEVDGMAWELGKEGSPIDLIRKRLEGAAFPMERWGSTPTVEGESHIEVLLAEMDLVFRFYIPCPHCGELQVLEWGSADSQHGMKWDNSKSTINAKAATAHYQCAHCHKAIKYNHLAKMEKSGVWKAEDGTWTADGINFFDAEDNLVQTPSRIGIHCWAGYSLNLSEGWIGLVKEFLSCKGDPVKLRPFVNLVLGETWKGDDRDKLDYEVLHNRREIWWKDKREDNPVPNQACVLTGGIDTQDDRVELYVWAWGYDEECWLVDHIVILGDLSNDVTKEAVGNKLYNTYRKSNGEKMDVRLWCWDAMGHKTDEVYKMSRRHGTMWVFPIQGENKYGKEVANVPRKKNAKKVYLVRVGTDGIKARLYARLNRAPSADNSPVAGCVHFPVDDKICGEEFFKQLCSASKKLEIKRDGSKAWRWVKQFHAFDEALDGWVYAFAALDILIQRFGFVMTKPKENEDTHNQTSIKELAAKLGG